jgi:hypothetical protein
MLEHYNVEGESVIFENCIYAVESKIDKCLKLRTRNI